MTTRAGKAAAARRPPFIAERCFLRQLISPIGAPDFKRVSLISRFSPSVSPGMGSTNNAEAPPEIKNRRRSDSVRSVARSKNLFAADWPTSSGSGCPASITSIFVHKAACPYLVTATPASPPVQQSSTVAAIEAAAFPAPSKSVLPAGDRGRCGAKVVLGSAAATAASNKSRKNLTGSAICITYFSFRGLKIKRRLTPQMIYLPKFTNWPDWHYIIWKNQSRGQING